MIPKDVGGAAFPFGMIDTSVREGFYTQGMSLLDYFAGQVLASGEYNVKYSEQDSIKEKRELCDYVSERCYDIAEAMIREKRKREMEAGK